MKTITPSDLIEFAGKHPRLTLSTLGRGTPFSVSTKDGKLIYTPSSTMKPRTQSPKALGTICKHYSESGSLRPGDYAAITTNASYALALIDACTKEAGSRKASVGSAPVAKAPRVMSKERKRLPEISVLKAAPTLVPREEGKPSRRELLATLKKLQAAARRSDDLLKSEYRNSDRSEVLNGHCYAIVECMKRLYPDEFKVYRVGWPDGGSHYFLRDQEGRIFESISEDATECLPARDYRKAKGRGLLTSTIGRRAKELMRRAGLSLREK